QRVGRPDLGRARAAPHHRLLPRLVERRRPSGRSAAASANDRLSQGRLGRRHRHRPRQPFLGTRDARWPTHQLTPLHADQLPDWPDAAWGRRHPGNLPRGDFALKIKSIDCLGLFGKSPKGGWTNEIQPEDSVHALVIVKTDDGHMGVGSVFTDSRLVEAALAVLRPLVIGESGNEPMRVTEKLHQNTFWMGHGGTLTHTISGIDIALWDIFG